MAALRAGLRSVPFLLAVDEICRAPFGAYDDPPESDDVAPSGLEPGA